MVYSEGFSLTEIEPLLKNISNYESGRIVINDDYNIYIKFLENGELTNIVDKPHTIRASVCGKHYEMIFGYYPIESIHVAFDNNDYIIEIRPYKYISSYDNIHVTKKETNYSTRITQESYRTHKGKGKDMFEKYIKTPYNNLAQHWHELDDLISKEEVNRLVNLLR